MRGGGTMEKGQRLEGKGGKLYRSIVGGEEYVEYVWDMEYGIWYLMSLTAGAGRKLKILSSVSWCRLRSWS